jgi:RNA polymerase sigma-70 factor, ECF subfamily
VRDTTFFLCFLRLEMMQTMETGSKSSTQSSLLRRAATHDVLAWRELVELYGPLISTWCRRSGADWHMTADCIQEVFLVLANRLGSFRPTGLSRAFRAWLWSISRNKLIDLHRANQRQAIASGGSTAHLAMQAIAEEDVWMRDEPTEAIDVSFLTRRAIEQVRSEFTAQSWKVFERTVVDGIETSVVAIELGLSTSAIRQAKSRILRRLRQQLGDLE